MGQTLTHGIYLPDEGERNCYSGLAANWQILDSSVGTIAAHTAALSGKAPLVHTHIKSDITDFPAYGNTAGTICEGNDSRLSDARTPVAHTHTKSDVTDLFNSANTWTALNTYSNGRIRIKSLSQEIGVTPSSGVIQYLEFADKNDVQHGKVGLWDYDNGASEIQLSISDKYKDGVKDSTGTRELTFLSFGFKTDGSKFLTFSGQLQNSLVPNANNSYDLGSSSYQWNNLYAKNYYYNGTAWGLDKANTWTGTNTFTSVTAIKTTAFNIARSQIPDSDIAGRGLDFQDNNSVYWGSINPFWNSNGIFGHRWYLTQYNTNNAQGVWSLSFYAKKDFSEISFIPDNNKIVNLGTSEKQWKTLNGINPGALSLPSGDSVNIDTTNWNFSWNANYATAPFDGYISIACFGSFLQINNETKSYAMTFAPGADGFICGLLPVSAGDSIKVAVNRTQTSIYEGYKFIKSRGNVS